MITWAKQGVVTLLICLATMLCSTETFAYRTEAPLRLSDVAGSNIKHISPTYSLSNQLPPRHLTEFKIWSEQLVPFDLPAAYSGSFAKIYRVYNDTNQENWFIHPKGATIQTIDIVVATEDQIQWHETGFLKPHQEPLHYGNTVFIPRNTEATVALIFDSSYYLAEYDISLYPEREALRLMRSEATIVIICLGICFALGLYNLFLYIGGRELAYLYYSISTLSFAFGWSNALGFWQIFAFAPIEFLLLPPFLIGAAYNMWFARAFLSLEKLSPKLDLLLVSSAWFCLILLPVASFFPSYGFYLVTLATSVSLVSGLIAGIYCWREGYRPARYFVMAFIAVAAPNLIGNLLNLGVFESAPVNTYLFALLGVTLDALLLAFALADKMRLVSMSHNQLAANLEQKVTLRTEALAQANTAMEHLIDELQGANSAKNHFLANMSHEIRTPLTSIIGYTESILLGDVDQKEQRRILNVISENSQHLLHIINDILDISKIEADKLEFEQVETPLHQVFSQVDKLMSPMAREKNIHLVFEHHFPQPSKVISDPTRLRQILFNIINNAVKFTLEGEIKISTRYRDDQLYIKVQDSGIGMDKMTMQNIFNPFSQGESTTTRKFGGTGLGLSISRRLAQGLGGDIGVESKIGKGSTFSINIHAPETEDSVLLHSYSDNEQNTDDHNDRYIPSLVGNRILLVDDNPHNLDLITLLLNRMDVCVDTATNGEDALDKVFSNEYQLILMDIQMPGMSGVEATEKIRKCGYTLPIIALTANNMTHEIESYMRKGFTSHLAKPIVRQEFISTLERYLTSQGSNQSLLSAEDMLPIISDYYKSLDGDLALFEKAWDAQDHHEVQELAHRIKGAAGSFGFAPVGEHFAKVEEALKTGQTESLPELVSKTIDYTRRCLNMTGFNVPLAVCHHEQDIALFFASLNDLQPKIQEDIEEIERTANAANASISMMHINRLSKRIERCCWESMNEQLSRLKAQLKDSPEQSAEIKQILTTITTMRGQLETHLA